MLCKISSTFYLFFSFLTISLFGHNAQGENEKALLEQLNISHKIIAYASEAIKWYEDGKLYLDENRFYETDSGLSLTLSNGEVVSLSSVVTDSIGAYLATLGMVNNKFFKNVCNRCHYEWSGGVFDVWCPNCGDADWSTVRDRG
jgi:hypothetical protein